MRKINVDGVITYRKGKQMKATIAAVIVTLAELIAHCASKPETHFPQLFNQLDKMSDNRGRIARQ